MLAEIITQGLDLMSFSVPQEWDECMLVHLEDGAMSIIFKDGVVSIVQGEQAEAESVVKLTNRQVCDAIDGSTDIMLVWRQLAEPSPTDKSTVLKGSGAKLTTVIECLTRCYTSKAEFKKIVDEFKSQRGQPFHPFQNPVPPESNKTYKYEIELRPLFYTFKSGHKIWVQISNLDLNYQLFLHTIYASEMLPVPAENTVYHDTKHPSYLLLPIIPDSPIIKEVEPPLSQIKWPSKFMA